MVYYELFEGDTVIRSTNPFFPYEHFSPPRILGKGVYSEVELVQDRTGRSCAIKKINCIPRNFQKYLEEFLLCGFPKNDYCVTPNHITWTEGPDDSSEVILEFDVYDGNLEDLFKDRPLGMDRIDDLIKIYAQLKEAVYFLLDNGIYHVDIKPPNILYRLDRDEETNETKLIAKIADFGIAVRTPCLSDLTKNFKRFVPGGTRSFYPPEQQEYRSYNSSSMFYTLALSMYLCFTQDIKTMKKFAKSTSESRPVIDLRNFYPLCTDKQIGFLREISSIINAEAQERALFIPPRSSPEDSLRINYQSVYSSQREILDKIRPFYSGRNDEVIIRKFLLAIYQEALKSAPYSFDGNKGELKMGIIEFIKMVDCLSRFLKQNNYFESLIPMMAAIIRSEIFYSPLYLLNDKTAKTVPWALAILNVLDYRLFDCRFTSAFFCLKNNPRLDNQFFMDPNDYLPDVFLDPPTTLMNLIITKNSHLIRECQQNNAYENLIRPADYYHQF